MTILDTLRPRTVADLDHQEYINRVAWEFRQACIGAGVALAVDAPVAGTGWTTPRIAFIEYGNGHPLRIMCRMPPGWIPSMLRDAGRLIAPHLGGRMLRVVDKGEGWADVRILIADPLDTPLGLDLDAPGILLGRTENNDVLSIPHPRELPHIICQGATRSGKSVWSYGFLSQCVRCGPDVEIAGCDASGLTLRPFVGNRFVSNGLANPEDVVRRAQAVVREMDERLARMPADQDILTTDEQTPVILFVCEELAGTYRALDGLKTKDNDPGKQLRACLARLLSESHKVGIRCLLLLQRAEASIVDAAVRAQCSGRISFRVDSTDSLKLLHDADGALSVAGEHIKALPGVGVIQWPGMDLSRFRAPFIGQPPYRCYIDAVSPYTLGTPA